MEGQTHDAGVYVQTSGLPQLLGEIKECVDPLLWHMRLLVVPQVEINILEGLKYSPTLLFDEDKQEVSHVL